MGIRRTALPFDGQFTQVPNAWLRDERLSRKARGFLAEIASHKIGWHVTVAGLMAGGPEGREAVRTALIELRDVGYLVVSQEQGADGRFAEVEYELRDPFTGVGKSDHGEPVSGFPTSDEPRSGFPTSDNPHHKNTRDEEDHQEEHHGAASLAPLTGEFELDIPTGSRVAVVFPSAFYLPPSEWEWAKVNVPSVDVHAVTRGFVEYWREGEGKGRKKKNWLLAWRNWLKKEHARNVDQGWQSPEMAPRKKVIRGGRVVA